MLDLRAEIGLVILMFMAGLEVDFNLAFTRLPGRGKVNPVILASVGMVGTLGLSWFISRRDETRTG